MQSEQGEVRVVPCWWTSEGCRSADSTSSVAGPPLPCEHHCAHWLEFWERTHLGHQTFYSTLLDFTLGTSQGVISMGVKGEDVLENSHVSR